MSNWFPALVAALALTFLGFVVGAATSFLDLPPGNAFHDAFRAAQALYVQNQSFQTPYQSNLWQPTAHEVAGVGRHEPESVATGFTLYTAGNLQGARLIDMNGDIVHEWRKRFYEVWPRGTHLDQQPDEDFIAWRKARIWPNGDLITLFIAEGITPWGMGVIKLDKNSNLLWSYPGKAHHDFDIGSDGRIYLLTHDIRDNGISGVPRIETPFLDDRIVILTADGEELQDIGILEAFLDSPHQDFLRTVPRSPIGDYLHVNALEVLHPDMAAAHPYLQAGDILISMRQPNALAAIRPSTGKVVRVWRGPWLGQHDPDFLPNGNILLFDNRGRTSAGGISRVLEFDPATRELEWQFHGSPEDVFQSGLRSAQQRLPNGNTLITESDRARLLEVTHSGRIVWEYVNPERGGPDNGYTPVLTWGKRYQPAELPFLGSTASIGD